MASQQRAPAGIGAWLGRQACRAAVAAACMLAPGALRAAWLPHRPPPPYKLCRAGTASAATERRARPQQLTNEDIHGGDALWRVLVCMVRLAPRPRRRLRPPALVPKRVCRQPPVVLLGRQLRQARLGGLPLAGRACRLLGGRRRLLLSKAVQQPGRHASGSASCCRLYRACWLCARLCACTRCSSLCLIARLSLDHCCRCRLLRRHGSLRLGCGSRQGCHGGRLLLLWKRRLARADAAVGGRSRSLCHCRCRRGAVYRHGHWHGRCFHLFRLDSPAEQAADRLRG